jgi:hypothetical protein
LGFFDGSSLPVSITVGKELFERAQAFLMMLCQVSSYMGVREKSLDVFTSGRQIEDVVAVIRFDAANVLEEFVGFLFHGGLLGFGGDARSGRRRGHQHLFSGAVQECSRETSGEFHGAHHEPGNVDLADRLHSTQGAECVSADALVLQNLCGFRAKCL